MYLRILVVFICEIGGGGMFHFLRVAVLALMTVLATQLGALPTSAQTTGQIQSLAPNTIIYDPFTASFAERLYERPLTSWSVQYVPAYRVPTGAYRASPVLPGAPQSQPAIGVAQPTMGVVQPAIGAVQPILIAAQPPAATGSAEAEKAKTTAPVGGGSRAPDTFFGGNFGLGLSYTHDLGSRDRVDSASVDSGGIVRVDDESNGLARLVLKSHFFTKCPSGLPLIGTFISEHDGCGLFVAAQLGSSDNIIDAVGGGFMLGFRPETWKQNSDTQNRSFNIGLGFMVDPDTQVLGDGIKANNSLPNGETEVRFKKSTQIGFMILFSYSWL